jgi:hypothetical protein
MQWGMDSYEALHGTAIRYAAEKRKSRRRLISWKAATSWRAASSRPWQGHRVNPSSGEHDRVAAADDPIIDHRGVDADVYCVVRPLGGFLRLWVGLLAAA